MRAVSGTKKTNTGIVRGCELVLIRSCTIFLSLLLSHPVHLPNSHSSDSPPPPASPVIKLSFTYVEPCILRHLTIFSMSPDNRNLILSVNAGSSSLKISVFLPIQNTAVSTDPDAVPSSDDSKREPLSLLFTSSVDSLSALPARFTFKAHAPDISSKQLKKQEIEEIKDHDSAFQYFLSFLEQNTRFDKSHVKHICHRVVHGGDYPGPVLISAER